MQSKDERATPHDDLLERFVSRIDSIRVAEQATDRGVVVRSLSLIGPDGKRLGGIAFAPSDALYDLPLCIEQWAAELSRLRKIEQAADELVGKIEADHLLDHYDGEVGVQWGKDVVYPMAKCRDGFCVAAAHYQAAKEGR